MDTSPLVSLLAEYDVSQAELARRLACGRSVVNNWAVGGDVPAERIAAICDALALSPARAAQLYRDLGSPLPREVERVAGLESVGHAPAVSSVGQSVDSVSHSA